jgi:hypothetical protein
MKPNIKPRNPFVALAKFRKAGAHTKPVKSLRRHEKQTLANAVKQSSESCHNSTAHQFGSVMTWVARIGIRLARASHRLYLRASPNQLDLVDRRQVDDGRASVRSKRLLCRFVCDRVLRTLWLWRHPLSVEKSA